MLLDKIIIHSATCKDLDNINQVVEQAVMSWHLPERVKRLTLPSYLYNEFDMEHMEFLLAESRDSGILGVAAWELADSRDIPDSAKALLLHGIYVAPSNHRQGIGRCLLQAVEDMAKGAEFNGILVKAQTDASGFFDAMGYRPLPEKDFSRDYQNRYWKSLDS